MDIVSLLFGFQGRINRAKYWIAVVIYMAAMVIVAALAMAAGMALVFFIVAVVVYIPMVISGIAVGIKRLHDRDKSGWWLLLFYLLPAVLSWAGVAIGLNFIFSLASLAVSIWAIVELGFLPGTAGANRYGPDPLRR